MRYPPPHIEHLRCPPSIEGLEVLDSDQVVGQEEVPTALPLIESPEGEVGHELKLGGKGRRMRTDQSGGLYTLKLLSDLK